MAFNNPPMSWSELSLRLSDGRRPNSPPEANGGDSPAWSRKRQPFESDVQRRPGAVPYAELHCHSNYSFLDGASHPEELAEEAARLGLEAIALTDHDGMYGVVRFKEAAKVVGIKTIFGAELSLGLSGPQNGVADPEGRHLLVLARDPEGYARLSRAISIAQSRGGEKGKPIYDMSELADAHDGHWLVLTGCRKGIVPAALATDGVAAAGHKLDELARMFGRDNVVVELWHHGDPCDDERNDALAALASDRRLPVVATNNVHYATSERRPLATALAAVRARRSLDEIDGWLPAVGSAYLRSGQEQARRFARFPGAVARAAEIGVACAFDLALIAPKLPDFPVPPGHTEMSFLRMLVAQGAQRMYGSPEANPKADQQIQHELDLIEQLGYPGYFLIVWDIVEFCRRNTIYCQGRGSAANSAVCYTIGITNVDSVGLDLLFERFLSSARDGPPDIDLDIESGRRELVIQYVYERYGRDRAAQVANVITYRPRSAVRDIGRALGFPMGRLDAWSKQIDHWGPLSGVEDHDIPPQVMKLANELQNFPRHLGIHSGGMVICDRPVIDVCPVEWARMADRSVLQWDKDDCAVAGLVKFDLLGLGMLSALHYAFDFLREDCGVAMDLADVPQDDPKVYDMLCAADTVGVFQVESRAQMATLPRLQPRKFFDLVVEVAIIRPGPIQGNSVHPYIRRRHKEEPVTYLHPLLEKSLKKTLGVPLFQEQLMQMAIDVADFSPAEADQLRQAMSSKRSSERMAALRSRLYAGMASHGIGPDLAAILYDKLAAFANYGFPESHAVSFAFLVYASAWLKYYYPAAFCAALLNAQPMGFYSPQSLVADARRHGVTVLRPDINASRAGASLPSPDTVRLGLSSVRLISSDLAERIAREQPHESMAELVSRVPLTTAQLEALATAGVFDGLGLERRGALWAAEAVAQIRADQLAVVVGDEAPTLPGMDPVEQLVADIWATGISPNRHVVEFVRPHLDRLGAVSAQGLTEVSYGSRVLVGGMVTHRQRPATAGGVTFINLEDETGLINVICSVGVWTRYRRMVRSARALLVRGRLEGAQDVRNVVAQVFSPLPLPTHLPSRDFR
jgi:error-prone DNA polymerase